MKLCVIFPGIGYHSDKPLLYFAKKLVKKYEYEMKEVAYPHLTGDILHNEMDRRKAIDDGLSIVRNSLRDVDFTKYESILFVSKSIGTAICLQYANEIKRNVDFVLYTPIQETFHYMNDKCIVFHGTNDIWLDHNLFKELSNQHNCTYYVYDDLNHSLEKEDVLFNIEVLMDVMKKTDLYLMEIYHV